LKCYETRVATRVSSFTDTIDIGETLTGDITGSIDLNVGEINHPTERDVKRIV